MVIYTFLLAVFFSYCTFDVYKYGSSPGYAGFVEGLSVSVVLWISFFILAFDKGA